MLTANPNVALILIVEDDNNHAELIQRSFEEAPDEYRLEFVGTICAAKRAMELNPPGLVLTDYRLPDGDGSELVMMASGLMPVIIMTSHGSEQVAVEAMKIGAQDYIVKSSETFESLPIAVKYGLITWALTSARKQAAAAALREQPPAAAAPLEPPPPPAAAAGQAPGEQPHLPAPAAPPSLPPSRPPPAYPPPASA